AHCFVAGGAGYRIADSGPAGYTVRIDNTAPNPALRMQIVDDPAAADFVLIDDSASDRTCRDAERIRNILVNAEVADPDLTVSLSREPADHKIYVRSASYSEQEAAALLAVMWTNAQQASSGRREVAEVAARQ